MRKLPAVLAAALTAASLGAAVPAASAAAGPRIAQPPSADVATAVTAVTHHPDSGVQGNNWAADSFTRTAGIWLTGTAPVADCPHARQCWAWAGTITDLGTFTTVAGQKAPRAGTLDQSLTGRFAGGSQAVLFFASFEFANPLLVAKTVSGPVSGDHTTTDWVEQFFPPSTVFNSAANPGGPDLGAWAWTYTLPFGADRDCPNDASQWVDSAADGGGAQAADGNILTPDAAHCT